MNKRDPFPGVKLKDILFSTIQREFDTDPESATEEQLYYALCKAVKMRLSALRGETNRRIRETKAKQVYYLSMEYLVGKSLRNNLSNLGLTEEAEEAVRECGLDLEKIYDFEPDAALGNGGLGRLAACYLDSLAKLGYPATGYTLLYEYGIFKQLIEGGAQKEAPDGWLSRGNVWLEEKRSDTVEVRFGGYDAGQWYGSYYSSQQRDYETILAVPYDLYISGYDSDVVSRLRLWSAESPGIDMDAFNRGDYAAAMLKNNNAQLITKILYPNDNQIDGKILRLRQQYLLCAASVADIVKRHLETYRTLDNLPEKAAIHVNDTHPTLAIPELMRILMDECGYGWDAAFDLTRRTFAYTNHTVLSEALERWSADLIRSQVPRLYVIIEEINKRLMKEAEHLGPATVERMKIVAGNEVRTANLCAYVCHSVNGVSALHSDIVRDTLFADFAALDRDKFTNVTNGIAYRRWLLQGNPELTGMLSELIGDGFKQDASQLSKLNAYRADSEVLDELGRIKRRNKEAFAEYASRDSSIRLDPSTLFDVQVKRIHEYKRQHLSALCIVRRYLDILAGEGGDFVPRTYIFGGKAAPGYHTAKEIIRLICSLGTFLSRDKRADGLLNVAFMPNYRVSMSEVLMPAAEISEQISLAGKEASGTGNMKLMLSGALTVGTLDGANVEIREAAGEENFFLFGATKEQVNANRLTYDPHAIYKNNRRLGETLDFIASGALGDKFTDLVLGLERMDPYMVLGDFDDYCRVQYETDRVYRDPVKWNAMSLANIAGFGKFSSDRAVREYCDNIWEMEPLR